MTKINELYEKMTKTNELYEILSLSNRENIDGYLPLIIELAGKINMQRIVADIIVYDILNYKLSNNEAEGYTEISLSDIPKVLDMFIANKIVYLEYIGNPYETGYEFLHSLTDKVDKETKIWLEPIG